MTSLIAKFRFLLIGLTLLMSIKLVAQKNVGVGTTSPDKSAVLDIVSVNQGLLVPRTDTNAISSPAKSLLIYQVADDTFYYFDGLIWRPLGSTTQGQKGATGPTGLNGASGKDGVTGSTGLKGDKGVTGPTGLKGDKGDKGDVGSAGPVGCSSANYVIKSNGSTAICSQIIDDGVNVGIGVASPSYKLHVAGRLKTDGINETSDRRFKKDIITISSALDKVEKLRGVYFNWNTEEFKSKGFETKKQVGLIAQEVEEVLPEVVQTDIEGYKSVEYSKLTALLIEAIKELKQENKLLKERNSEIQQVVAEIKSENLIQITKLEAEIAKIKNSIQYSETGMTK